MRPATAARRASRIGVRAGVDVGERHDVRGGDGVHGRQRPAATTAAGSASSVAGWTVTATTGGRSAIPRRASSSARSGRSARTAASSPGAPTTWMVAGSSPRARTRAGVLLVADEVEVASLVIAWRSASSKAPRVCSPPWRWMIGTRLERRGERGRGRLEAVADEQQRRRAGLGQRGSRSVRERGAAWTAAGGVAVAAARPASGRARSRPHDVVDRAAVAGREVHPAGQQDEAGLGVGPEGQRGGVEDAPVLAAGGQDRDRARQGALSCAPSTQRRCRRAPRRHLRARRRTVRPTSPSRRPGRCPLPGGGPRGRRHRWPRRRSSCGRPVQAPASHGGDIALRIDRDLLAAAERRGRSPGSPDHRGELVGLQRQRRGRGRASTGRASGASRRGPRRGAAAAMRQLDAGRVVGPADRNAERGPHGVDRRRFASAGARDSSTRNGTAPPARRRRLRWRRRAAATSTIVAMPVETSSGRPRRARWARNGRFVSSPEPTLKAGTSRASSRSAEASSNGVERKIRPRSSACSRSSGQASVGEGEAGQHRALAVAADRRRRAGTRRSARRPTRAPPARTSGT